MTAEYNRHGIRFLYPVSWRVTDEQFDTMPRSVTVESESGAFWSLGIHPFSVDPDVVLDQTLDAMREEYDEIELSEAREVFGGERAHGFNLTFWCLDFVVSSQIWAFRHGHATMTLMYQAEDREFEELQAVFAAITTSLLSEHDASTRVSLS